MLIKKYKSLKIRNQIFKFEIIQKIFKILCINILLAQKLLKKKIFSILNILNLKKKFIKMSKIKNFNRCILTNRKGGIVRSYSISRLKMHEYLKLGLIPGYIKAIW